MRLRREADKMMEKVKRFWKDFFVDDRDDETKLHLSQADKRSLWYGCFLICCIMVCFCSLAIAASNIKVNRQNDAVREETIKTIAAYIAFASEDEYREITEKIRQDISISEIGEDLENYMKYIPNIADWCRADLEDLSARVFLVCTNTGDAYALDLFESRDDQESKSNGMKMTIGSDETSGADIQVVKYSDRQEGYAEISRGNDAVSLLKMKTIFCDDCIRKILDVIVDQPVQNVVIYDSEEKIFYPVEDGSEVQIGDYLLETVFGDGEIRIEITRN